jgi:hypothetical protein
MAPAQLFTSPHFFSDHHHSLYKIQRINCSQLQLNLPSHSIIHYVLKYIVDVSGSMVQ